MKNWWTLLMVIAAVATLAYVFGDFESALASFSTAYHAFMNGQMPEAIKFL